MQEDAYELISEFKAGGEVSHAELADALKIIKSDDEEAYFQIINSLDEQDLGLMCANANSALLKDLLNRTSLRRLSAAIAELESDDATDLMQRLHEIDAKKSAAVFGYLNKDDQADILFLSRYEDNCVGAWMQTEMFTATLSETLQTAVQRYKALKHSEEIENIMQLFITDDTGELAYQIPVGDLIMYEFSATFADILSNHPQLADEVHSVKDYADIKEAISIVQDYDLSVLAVTDEGGRLIGRLTYDDIHDLLQEHATEQIYGFAGVGDAQSEDENIFKAARSRANWLLVNMITSLLSANVIALFSGAIEQLVALAALMPIVASMGGNTGSQALAVTVRKLALGEIDFSTSRTIITREICISLINASVFALLMGAVSWIWWNMPMLSLVMFISMVLNLCFAGLIGSLIPLTLNRLKIDPAVGSSVLLTALTDAVGFFSFLLLAKLILL